MPLNALFDALCIVHSVGDILTRAVAIQARKSSATLPRRLQHNFDEQPPAENVASRDAPKANLIREIERSTIELPTSSGPLSTPSELSATLERQPIRRPFPATAFRKPAPPPLSSYIPPLPSNPASAPLDAIKPVEPVVLEPDIGFSASDPVVTLTASKVPSSQLGRIFHYGSLAAGLGMGAASEMLRRSTGGSDNESGSLLLSAGNVSRLVDKLSKMRGAALKLGQFMSIQDSHLLPEQLEGILRQVQAGAHYMPNWQMEKVMTADLGPDWRSNFSTFDAVPFASASIGQVHRATLAPHIAPHLAFRDVAVKVQFPNIKASIHSDLRSLSYLLYTSKLLPKGLFLDKTLEAMEEELEDECDYLREAESAKRFRQGLGGDERFGVMQVVDELCSKNVLVMERLEGVPIIRALKLSQEKRDRIGTDVLSLCMKELFHLRFMQTDPNWSNFLYNQKTDQIELIDFGASRSYTKEFMDNWYLLLSAAVRADRAACEEYSLKLGYLTGDESPEMLDAHIQSVTLIGRPFAPSTPQPYAFAPSSHSITSQIRELIPVMLKHRLTPPPRETYSLNRKLSGAFLLCERLGARVDCREVWERETGGYTVG